MSVRYGPNTTEIEALIEKFKTITPEQAEKLYLARYATKDVFRDLAMYEAVDATCYEHWIAARDAAMEAIPDDASDAWDAIWDATLALVVRGRISKGRFDLLYGPWRSVMEAEE